MYLSVPLDLITIHFLHFVSNIHLPGASLTHPHKSACLGRANSSHSPSTHLSLSLSLSSHRWSTVGDPRIPHSQQQNHTCCVGITTIVCGRINIVVGPTSSHLYQNDPTCNHHHEQQQHPLVIITVHESRERERESEPFEDEVIPPPESSLRYTFYYYYGCNLSNRIVQ